MGKHNKGLTKGQLKNVDASVLRFENAIRSMIATNLDSYNSIGSSLRAEKIKPYTREEALETIRYGNPNELRQLSMTYFYTSGFYRMMILYYATLLTYATLVIPKMSGDKKVTSQVTNIYDKAMDYVDNLKIEELFTFFAVKVLVEGAYYGLICHDETGKENIVTLPFEYSRCRFKTFEGIDVIEFNLAYFDGIYDKNKRIACLKTYPDEIRLAYNKYKNRGGEQWLTLPPEDCVHFMFLEERPIFSDIIPAVIDFGDYRELEKDKDTQALYKILVQEMPHTNDGELVFEPEEVAPMHRGIAQMLAKQKGMDVVTSFGTVKVADMQNTHTSVVTNNLDKISSSIYEEAGVSGELFAASNSTSLDRSIKKDTGIMMYLGQKFTKWLQYVLNCRFSNKSVDFLVNLLPITEFNYDEMYKNASNGTQYGYSILLPYLCLGIKQSDVKHLKILENDILKLHDIMKPLESANTMSPDSATAKTSEEGRKKAEQEGKNMDNKKTKEEKTETTIKREESGGGNE